MFILFSLGQSMISSIVKNEMVKMVNNQVIYNVLMILRKSCTKGCVACVMENKNVATV